MMLMLMRMMMMASKTHDVQFYVGIPVQGHHKPHNRSVRFSEPKKRERKKREWYTTNLREKLKPKKKKVTDKTGLIV